LFCIARFDCLIVRHNKKKTEAATVRPSSNIKKLDPPLLH
jgi:hypothetical protein